MEKIKGWLDSLSEKELKRNFVISAAVAIVLFLGLLIISSTEIKEEPFYENVSYELIEDNQVETLIGIYEDNYTAIIALNRWEDKMYITTLDGQGIPETKEVK